MVKGYTYNPTADRNKPFQAQMSVNSRTVCLGYFKTAEEATEAYRKARKETPRVPNYKVKSQA